MIFILLLLTRNSTRLHGLLGIVAPYLLSVPVMCLDKGRCRIRSDPVGRSAWIRSDKSIHALYMRRNEMTCSFPKWVLDTQVFTSTEEVYHYIISI